MKLYLVPTPVGNLGDITLRALQTLREVGLILAEDTRTSSVLLRHFDIAKPISPYHRNNEHRITPHLVRQLQDGKSMALLTDAGTPGVSDPGFLLVRACILAGVPVECLPGPTAFLPALVASGIPMNRFVFEGFLPLKKGRKSLLSGLSAEMRTMVFYESPLRLAGTLEEFVLTFGPQRACSVARELTKIHEEHRRGTLLAVCEHFRGSKVRGECVIIVAGLESS
ncbi:MAG TPA: 16S rRNA (cytidine(1402)-2'-O)-methyltransferase [Chitinophagaceae bacterium]|nr:16S rRNA (cytidine(1402)-2'-O)-methyltransferase [Chitinophagaceae bacterium]